MTEAKADRAKDGDYPYLRIMFGGMEFREGDRVEVRYAQRDYGTGERREATRVDVVVYGYGFFGETVFALADYSGPHPYYEALHPDNEYIAPAFAEGRIRKAGEDITHVPFLQAAHERVATIEADIERFSATSRRLHLLGARQKRDELLKVIAEAERIAREPEGDVNDYEKAVFQKPLADIYKDRINPLDILRIFGIDAPNIVFDPSVTLTNCHFRKKTKRMWHDGTQAHIYDLCLECFKNMLSRDYPIAAYYIHDEPDWSKLEGLIYRVGLIRVPGVYVENPPAGKEQWMNFLRRARMPVVVEQVYNGEVYGHYAHGDV